MNEEQKERILKLNLFCTASGIINPCSLQSSGNSNDGHWSLQCVLHNKHLKSSTELKNTRWSTTLGPRVCSRAGELAEAALWAHSQVLQVTHRGWPWVGVIRGRGAVLLRCGRSVSFLLVTLAPVIYKVRKDHIRNCHLMRFCIRDLLSQKQLEIPPLVLLAVKYQNADAVTISCCNLELS